MEVNRVNGQQDGSFNHVVYFTMIKLLSPKKGFFLNDRIHKMGNLWHFLSLEIYWFDEGNKNEQIRLQRLKAPVIYLFEYN